MGKDDARYVLRVARSGVWLGVELLGEGIFPGTWAIRGRRAHRWRGAVDCSQLSQRGPREDSRVTDLVTHRGIRIEDIIDCLEMSPAALAALDRCPVAEPTQ